ncbi:hypothetical protein TWF173_010920 [Orbilia oligospora]|nr:hypothetical protein TWF173_010920 [Orbilia oligospora]
MKSTTLVTKNFSRISLLLLPLIRTASGFYLEAAVSQGAYFTRPYPLKSGNGKPEVKGLYECIRASDLLLSNPTEGIAVWNRPGSQPTLAVALYYGSSCSKSHIGKAKPRVMMLLDPDRIRGVHVVNFNVYGISPECKSWQGVRIREELRFGGALYGYDPSKLRPGSIVHWNEAGIRSIETEAIKWINAIPYEPLTSKRSISQYLREVVETHVNPEVAMDPVREDTKIVMRNINGFLGITGDAIKDHPLAKEYLPQLKLEIDDGYEPLIVATEGLGSNIQIGEVGPAVAEQSKKINPLIWNLEALIANKRATAEDIANQEIPMGELLDSFNLVPDTPSEKRGWYLRFESLMTYNLQVLANAWRIFWAWERAQNELNLARQGVRVGAGGMSQTEVLDLNGSQNTGRRQNGRNQNVASAQGMTSQLDPNRVEIEEEVGRHEGQEVRDGVHGTDDTINEELDEEIDLEELSSIEELLDDDYFPMDIGSQTISETSEKF